ncbi:transforming growth factor-beta-induced protein ig-h3-like isoform X1 [Argopecten irradians]|uniref:transforming growth factor-beta-induced protein ig-h3-like isoform X1 n=1 Tax=Argopecten irradians TaxID=31199 RepID=UPI00371EF443
MSKYALIFLLVLVVVSVLAEAHRGYIHRRVWPQRRPGRRGLGDCTPELALEFINFMRNFRYPEFKVGVDNRPAFEFSINFGGKNSNWWDGPNVCETTTSDEPEESEEEEVALDEKEDHHYMYSVSESCDVTQTVYKCVRSKRADGVETTTTVSKKCCDGFSRKPSDFGCPNEINLQSLQETANTLGLQQFLETANSVDLTDQLTAGNFTVFAPTNDAFNEFGNVLPASTGINLDMGSVLVVSESMIEELTSKVSRVMLGHLSTDILPTSSMQDEQLIDTLSPVDSKIRINFYENTGTRVMMANCQRVTSSDNLATNGVIHVVDQVLTPVTMTIIDIISKDPNLSYLKTALGRTALSSLLREEGQFTIYAPTDAAFRKLESGVLNRLLNQTSCLKKVLKNHILPNVICSGAVQGRSRTKTLLNSHLYLTRDEDDKIFVQDHQVVASDIMATNGVIHLVDQVLFLDRAKDVLDIASDQVPELMDLVVRAGLEGDLRNGEGITLFAPTTAALAKVDPETMNSLMDNTSALRDVLAYHVTSGVHSAKTFYNDQRLDSFYEDNQIRINKYMEMRHGSVGLAQCVPIISSSARICNGIVHYVNKVLTPPSGSAMQVLLSDPRFSKFVELLRQTNMEQIIDEDDPLTVLALPNEAFADLPRGIKDILRKNDTSQIEKLIQSNIIRGTLCCHAITNWFYTGRYVRPLAGSLLTLRSMYGTSSIGRATITECDLTATNGVIQVVDGFAARTQNRWNFNFWDFF